MRALFILFILFALMPVSAKSRCVVKGRAPKGREMLSEDRISVASLFLVELADGEDLSIDGEFLVYLRKNREGEAIGYNVDYDSYSECVNRLFGDRLEIAQGFLSTINSEVLLDGIMKCFKGGGCHLFGVVRESPNGDPMFLLELDLSKGSAID